MFFANEIGQRFSDAYETVEREIGQVKWYRYPYEAKRIFPILICHVQQPVAIQFFGSAVCGRAQFQTVCTLYSHIFENILFYKIKFQKISDALKDNWFVQ